MLIFSGFIPKILYSYQQPPFYLLYCNEFVDSRFVEKKKKENCNLILKID